MTLEQRKIQLAQSVLLLKDEQLLQKVERLLEQALGSTEFAPITLQELHQRLDLSEKEFEDGAYTTAADLLKKYE